MMKYLTWALINGPIGIINFIINTFYIFCMVCPVHGERIKQPLQFLLGSLVGSAVVYVLAVSGVFFSPEMKGQDVITQICLVVSVGCLSISISSSVWLNIFYYTQIVPAHRALFIWIKKNIKPITFCICLIDNIKSFLDLFLLLMDPMDHHGFELNATSAVDSAFISHAFIAVPVGNLLNQQVSIYDVMVFMQRLRFYFYFFVMMASSGVTVVYLGRHIRRMVINGQSISSAQLSSQLRVTITGILQGLLYFSFSVWREYLFTSQQTQSVSVNPYIRSTAVSFYMLGTTFTLGAGQSIFRQRAADMWSRLGRWCTRSLQ